MRRSGHFPKGKEKMEMCHITVSLYDYFYYFPKIDGSTAEIHLGCHQDHRPSLSRSGVYVQTNFRYQKNSTGLCVNISTFSDSAFMSMLALLGLDKYEIA
jgi:hypothetical protein